MKYRILLLPVLTLTAAGLLALSLASSSAMAEEPTTSPGIVYEPEGSFYLGYGLLSQHDSLKAAEYIYPHSSILFGMDLLACPLPHRYHFNGEFLNKYDFYADGGYAFRDLVLFRDILVGLHHNLDHFNYLYTGVAPTVTYQDRDPGDGYSLDYVNNLFSLRVKAPDYPLHAFLRHRYVEREGRIEERFLLGSIGSLIKTSESRDIDWDSDALTLGANSHLGPVEVEYALDLGDFDPGNNNVLYDGYPASSIFGRPADIYPHSVIPDTQSTANTFKLHSSYTGGIVASATLSNLSQKNDYSGTESTTWKGAFDFSWIPDPVIALFFKYRHQTLDMDTPQQVTILGAANTLSYDVRDSVSFDRDRFMLSGRYKPLSAVTLLSTYTYTHLKRNDIEEWEVLREETDTHSINLTAHARPFRKLKLKGIYDYTYVDNPTYNLEPDSSNRVRLSATYLPLPWLTVYADYVLAVTERDALHYLGMETLYKLGGRDGRSDRFLLSLSGMISEQITVSGSWAYSKWKVEQDLAYAVDSARRNPPSIDYGIPYTDEANSFSLSLNYLPREDIRLQGDLTYTLSEGKYVPGSYASTLALDDYSHLEARETTISLEAAKKFQRDWEVALKLYMDIYDDRVSDALDGEVYVTTLSLKRYF